MRNLRVRKQKSILLVEDDESLARSLEEKLQAEGYAVTTALDGDAGWEQARAAKFDLLILDIMLPSLDGLSLCRLIRNDKATADVPIIMLTARGTEVDKIVGLESGANDYIVKPFSLGEFLARVRVQMRQPSAGIRRQAELVTGDLRVDVNGRRAYKRGKEIKLSNKEFSLLAVFMNNSNAVLSRDFLIANVWGEDYLIRESDKRTVDVHIRWLREKIEDTPSKPRIISTVRGVGYRFEG